MTSPSAARLSPVALLLGVVLLPLVGSALAGRDMHRLFRFPPPLEIPSGYTKFSWPGAGAVLAVLAALALSWVVTFQRRPRDLCAHPSDTLTPRRAKSFPLWGQAALVWIVGWWWVAWNRGPEFASVQRYTFFPLWLGFIVAVNACTTSRTGGCLLTRAPRLWLTLFGASAVFWWIFEWLNRFVRNWHYLGVADFGPIAYAAHASLCFSTVLPAVSAVAELLGTYPRWTDTIAAGPAWAWFGSRGTALVLVSGGACALLLTGAFPPWFYPALWAAPLALFLGESVLSGRGGLPQEIARGDWRRAATWMVAGLICGFFWELWNWRSVAKWIYTVPSVERWQVFEMPLLGYAGYLPFGLECLLVIESLRTLDLEKRVQRLIRENRYSP